MTESGGCLVAVSGGADSVALLHLILRWRETTGRNVRIEVVHVDHGLRGPESVEDALFVKKLCRQWGVPFHLRTAAPFSERPRGMSLEEFLRNERHRCFDQVLEVTGLSVVAVGHSADDMAETFLMHLMRGAGLRGVSFRAVEARRAGWLVRPLGKTSRVEILAYLKEQDLLFREDLSNNSMVFTRNRVRAVLLPLMEREFNPSVREALGRSAELLSEAEDYLRRVLGAETEALLKESGNSFHLPVSGLMSRERFLQKEVVQEWVRRATGDRIRLTFRQTEQILAIAALSHGRVDLTAESAVTRRGEVLALVSVTADAEESPAGYSAGRRDDLIARELARQHLCAEPELPLACLPKEGIPVELTAGGEARQQVRLLDGSELTVELQRHPDLLGNPAGVLEIRNRRPGDRISRSVKLKDALINDKVPWFLRDFLVVLADRSGEVVHIFGMKRMNARIEKRPDRRLPVAVSSQRAKSEGDSQV